MKKIITKLKFLCNKLLKRKKIINTISIKSFYAAKIEVSDKIIQNNFFQILTKTKKNYFKYF